VILLKSARELTHMRTAGRILAEVKDRLRTLVKPGISTKEIDADVEAFIVSRGAASAFKGYRGFPATVCISINEEVVHGIPSAHRRIKEGDIVGLDLGCIVEGYYADCAFTLAIGDVPPKVQQLLDVTRESLDVAIAECRPGRRLSDVSHTSSATAFPSCGRSSATVSVARCTRIRRSRTSATRVVARSCGRAWSSPSSRW
jgi:methionyl aminopeptidase